MNWIDFLNDAELNANLIAPHPPEGRYLLGKILHDVSECLTTYQGVAAVASQAQLELPAECPACFAKWHSKIEGWKSQIKLLWEQAENLPTPSPEWPRLERIPV